MVIVRYITSHGDLIPIRLFETLTYLQREQDYFNSNFSVSGLLAGAFTIKLYGEINGLIYRENMIN